MYGIDALVQYEAAGHMRQVKWYPRGSGNLHSSFEKKAERLLGTSLAVAYDPNSPDDAIIGNPLRARVTALGQPR